MRRDCVIQWRLGPIHPREHCGLTNRHGGLSESGKGALSNNFQLNLERSRLHRNSSAAKMSDWEDDDDGSTSTSQNAYVPPRGRGWYAKTGDENFSDSAGRRPGFGRGRANRFGNATENRNDNYSPGKRNGFNQDMNSRGFGRGEGGFGRQNRDSKFSRGENRGDADQCNDAVNWRDRGARDTSRGFGRSRGGQGRERNSTEIVVSTNEVRYIIGECCVGTDDPFCLQSSCT